MPNRSAEPLAWLAFSAGGVVAALLAPALLFLFGLAVPLGWISPPTHAHLLDVFSHPITRIVLLGVCILLLLHFAHRLRYTLIDGLQLVGFRRGVTVVCYALAGLGTAAAAYVMLLAF